MDMLVQETTVYIPTAWLDIYRISTGNTRFAQIYICLRIYILSAWMDCEKHFNIT